jgi:hypothetical protein
VRGSVVLINQIVLWFDSLESIDQPAQVLCETCADNYCEVCFLAQHRKGSRKRHAVKPLGGQREKQAKMQNGSPMANGAGNGNSASLSLFDIHYE